jgi:hypothetical protein
MKHAILLVTKGQSAIESNRIERPVKSDLL